jgi:hypothetical protein
LSTRARAAELRGELAQAATLFARAGRLDEAARVMVVRGDAETDAAARLLHYVQALATAPPASSAARHVRRKRWTTVLSMSRAGRMTSALRDDLASAATELEAIGEHHLAAEAFALLGNVDGCARCLARAGDVEGLERFLAAELQRDREAWATRGMKEDFELLLASGQRREAVAMARASADEALRERGRSVESRRIANGAVHLALHGVKMAVCLGDEVVIGRAPEWESLPDHVGAIAVASVALSRRHIRVARSGGEAVVRDLGSRNRTTLRGLALAGEVPVGAGIELRLGGEVSLLVRPSDALPGAVAMAIAGGQFVAPLGPAMLGVGRWRLERAPDRWVELRTEDEPPAFAASLQLTRTVTLLAGDAIGDEREGKPLLELQGT